jgi:DnaJ family protein C protein 17
MKERADFYENLQRIKEEKQRYAEMVERFYAELRECHPEWELRRQAALQVRCSSIRDFFF